MLYVFDQVGCLQYEVVNYMTDAQARLPFPLTSAYFYLTSTSVDILLNLQSWGHAMFWWQEPMLEYMLPPSPPDKLFAAFHSTICSGRYYTASGSSFIEHLDLQ